MRLRISALLLTAALSIGGVARAFDSLMSVTPESIGRVEGLSVTSTPRSDGVVQFEITRKAPSTGVPRRGQLLLSEPGSDLATTAYVSPTIEGDATSFRVEIAPQHFDAASFHFIEAGGLGGTRYAIRLKDFAKAVPASR